MYGKKIGLLYSGQGSQIRELGKDFYHKFASVRELYDKYPKIKDLAFNANDDELAKTKNTQPVLILFQIAITNLLKGFLDIDAVMGLSLGEYGALYGAEVLNKDDLINLVKIRANSMSDVSEGLNLSSVAIIDNNFDFLFKNSGDETYYISNINSPKQVVITGENLDKQLKMLNENGYKKMIPLDVSGGFHSPYMKKTEDTLKKAFEDVSFYEPRIPIFFNYGGENLDIKKRMAEQVSHTIDVNNSLEKISKYCDVLIEIGANKILQSMVRKIDKEKLVYPLQTVEDYEKVRQEFGK